MLKLRLYFQMKEKTVKLKAAPVEQPKLKLSSSCHAAIACSGLIVTKKLSMSPKRALSFLLSPPNPSSPPPPPHIAQDQLTRPQNTVFFHLSKQSRVDPPRWLGRDDWGRSYVNSAYGVANCPPAIPGGSWLPILDLVCHDVFKDRFIFRHILEHFFSAKMEAPIRLWAHSKYKISKGKIKCL